jgi:hypothetical protein
VHGGRQEYKNALGVWVEKDDPKLEKTHGCLRAFDADVASLKSITDNLEENDNEEEGGELTVTDDLDSWSQNKKDDSQKPNEDNSAKRDATYVAPSHQPGRLYQGDAGYTGSFWEGQDWIKAQ